MEQSPLLFLRQSFALRNAQNVFGRAAIQKGIRAVYQECMTSPRFITPQNFLRTMAETVAGYPNSRTDGIANILETWWKNGQWPEIELKSVSTERLENQKWLTSVIAQHNGLFVPASVKFTLDDGSDEMIPLIQNKKGQIEASRIHDSKPRSITVAPDSTIYDQDRFNNSTDSPNVTFFPGNASSISDKDYLIAWLPYASLLPGRPLAFGAQANVLKHIHNGTNLQLEWSPSSHTGYFRFLHVIPKTWNIDSNVFFEQGHSGKRLASLTGWGPPFPWFPAKFGLALRRKQIVGANDTKTTSGAILSNVRFQSDSTLNFTLDSEAESSFPSTFQFLRKESRFIVAKDFANKSHIRWRNYYTHLTDHKLAFSSLLSDPTDFEGAQFKLKGLDPVSYEYLASTGITFKLPAGFGHSPSSYFLSDRLRWRADYDFGVGRLKNGWTHLESRGVGAELPFGGDMIGGGSLTLSRLTILLAQSRIDGRSSSIPSFYFDITGRL
jgi:hypothetical protein